MLAWAKSLIFAPEYKYSIVKPIPNFGVNKLFVVKDKSGQQFVLKLILESCNNDAILLEYQNVRGFNSEHIIKAYDYEVISKDGTLFQLPASCEDFAGGIAIVLEYCDGGDLKSLGSDITEEVKMEYARQIINAITLIHEKGMLHRDIKPQNIFLKKANGRLIAVVGDFGESKFTDDVYKTKTHTKRGTPQYEAPEVINGGKYCARADAYSVGMTLIELFSPISFDLSQWLNKENRDNRNDLNIPETVPVAIQMCVWAMTIYSTEYRLTVAEIVGFISHDNDLHWYKTILDGIWRVRGDLKIVWNNIQNSVDDIVKTMKGERAFSRSIHQADEKRMDEILGQAKIDLRNLQHDIDNYDSCPEKLLDKGKEIKARLEKYLLQLKNYLEWNKKVLNIIMTWLRNNSIATVEQQKSEHIRLHTEVSIAFLNDANRPGKDERDYYNMKELDKQFTELIQLVEYHGINKRLHRVAD